MHDRIPFLQVNADALPLRNLDRIRNDAHSSDVCAGTGTLDDQRALRVPLRVEGDDVVRAREGGRERVSGGVPASEVC